jgi:5-methylcytosine-specific restriction endonuclease McrA
VNEVDRCIILNGDYTFLNTVNWKRAMCLIMKGKVEILKFSERVIRSGEGISIQVPLVMKLIKLIRSIYKSKVPFSKRNVMIRDKFKCVYCGVDDSRLTIDHVIPVSRGGKTTFDNCVSSCKPCNSRKGSRTPSEAKMFLKRQPYTPTISEFIRLKMKQLGIDKLLMDLGVY